MSAEFQRIKISKLFFGQGETILEVITILIISKKKSKVKRIST